MSKGRGLLGVAGPRTGCTWRGCRWEKSSGQGGIHEAEKGKLGALKPELLNSAWEELGAVISSGFRGSQAGSPMEHLLGKTAG